MLTSLYVQGRGADKNWLSSNSLLWLLKTNISALPDLLVLMVGITSTIMTLERSNNISNGINLAQIKATYQFSSQTFYHVFLYWKINVHHDHNETETMELDNFGRTTFPFKDVVIKLRQFIRWMKTDQWGFRTACVLFLTPMHRKPLLRSASTWMCRRPKTMFSHSAASFHSSCIKIN